MKSILIVLAILLMASCQKQASTNLRQQYPDDVELFSPEKDVIAVGMRRPPKPSKGGGNPNNPPIVTDIITDLATGEVCIYLDHDGELVSGTMWNVNGDLNLSASGLTITQKDEIRLKVQADYAKEKGFVKMIKVTDSLSIYNSFPINKRVHVIITASHEWYPASVGGVAYVNSYLWADDTPSFVFSRAYGYNEDYIAHASTHEPGHMFGLRHQALWEECTLINAYRPGWNMGRYNGSTGIFGVGLNHLCCTCVQDDMSIMNSNL